MGFLAVGEGLLGGYAAVAGTLEEQFGYVVVVLSPSRWLCGARPARARPDAAGAPVRPRLFLVTTALLGGHRAVAHDDGFRRVRAWMDTELPPGARVGLTGVTAEFALLPHPGYGVWPSLCSLADNDAEYVVTQGATLSQGYGYAAPELLTWLHAHAWPVFCFTGPSNGATIVWKLDRASSATRWPAGCRSPRSRAGSRDPRRRSAPCCAIPRPGRSPRCAAAAGAALSLDAAADRRAGDVLRRPNGPRRRRGRECGSRPRHRLGSLRAPARGLRRRLRRGCPPPGDDLRGRRYRLVLGPGLQYPPGWVLGPPAGTYRNRAGETPDPPVANLVFSRAVRDAAADTWAGSTLT